MPNSMTRTSDAMTQLNLVHAERQLQRIKARTLIEPIFDGVARGVDLRVRITGLGAAIGKATQPYNNQQLTTSPLASTVHRHIILAMNSSDD
ncbi:MAG: hypothetical protein ABSA16_01090 [Thermoguttaceae bacterium]